MFRFEADKFSLIVFCSTFLTSLALNLYTIHRVTNNSKRIQDEYKRKYNNLKISMVQKQDEQRTSIEQHVLYCENNFALDAKQLKSRSEKVIDNINTSANSKLKKYFEIEKTCFLKLEILITDILKESEKTC